MYSLLYDFDINMYALDFIFYKASCINFGEKLKFKNNIDVEISQTKHFSNSKFFKNRALLVVK